MSIEITALNQLAATMNTGTASKPDNSAETGFSDVLKSTQKADLDAIFEAASRKYNVPVNMLKAVAKAESSFRPDATSKCGAMGIMQLMPGTAKSLGVTDAYDPEQNIMGGAKYLSQQLDRFGGDVSLALAAYNAGPGAVAKYDGIPPYNETQNYVKKVMGYMNGSDISAGSVSYTGTAKQTYGGGIRDTGTESETSNMTDVMVEMFMMKMLEMQTSSSDEDRKVF